MSAGAAAYRYRVAEEERRRRVDAAKVAAMTPEQRSQVAAGLASLRYLLDRLPRSYRGPMATAEDCASIANVDAYLARNKITPSQDRPGRAKGADPTQGALEAPTRTTGQPTPPGGPV